MTWESKRGTELLRGHDWVVQRNRTVLFAGARVIDPSQSLDKAIDLLVERGRLAAVGEVDQEELPDDTISIDLRGKILCPGLQDMHAHLGEPGREDRETLVSGMVAAAAGGFTGVAVAPDSDPFVDNAGIVRWISDRTSGSPVTVQPTAAIARDSGGRRLTDIDDIYAAGVRVFSDAGRRTANAEIMRRALEYCKLHDLLISSRSYDTSLSETGVVREGTVSTRLGQAPWPSIAESVAVARNLLLAMHTGTRIHLEAVSSAESLALIRWARERGVQVSCDTTPHHLALTDEECESFDGAFKMTPPLGTEDDRDALRAGVRDGTIDAIASDHFPLTDEECLVEFSLVPDGVVGLETALGVVARELATGDKVDWVKLVELLAVRPREILQLPPAQIRQGAPAELAIIDPDAAWTVEPSRFFSKAHNTPFAGSNLPAKSLGVLNHGWLLVAPDARMLLV